MSYLLDTHVYLFWTLDDQRLSTRARELFENRRCRVFLSAASVWEIAIKHALGKLRLSTSLSRVVVDEPARCGISTLPITREHACRTGELPMHHHDPFDRMLVAQAQLEALTLVTLDPSIRAYDVRTIW